MPPVRCFNCNMIGHFARNCFTKTRPQNQNRQNFPRQFTRNFRKRNQRQPNQRYQPPRVRFQDQYQDQYNSPGPYNSNDQGRDGHRYPPFNRNRNRYVTENQDPNAYSDQEQEEYYGQQYGQNPHNDRYLN